MLSNQGCCRNPFFIVETPKYKQLKHFSKHTAYVMQQIRKKVLVMLWNVFQYISIGYFPISISYHYGIFMSCRAINWTKATTEKDANNQVSCSCLHLQISEIWYLHIKKRDFKIIQNWISYLNTSVHVFY